MSFFTLTTSGMRWYKGQSVPFMNVFNPDSQVSTAMDVRVDCNMHVIEGYVKLHKNYIAMHSLALPCIASRQVTTYIILFLIDIMKLFNSLHR